MQILELADTLSEMDSLKDIRILMVQEVVCAAGIHMDEVKQWKILYGKGEHEWRGTAIVYKLSLGTHHHTELHTGGITTILHLAGQPTNQLGVLSGHIPWNATIAATEALLSEWESSRACHQSKCILGLDANETFKNGPHTITATTARGNTILDWFTTQNLRLPPQQMEAPSHFPYNPTMMPRRLDYLGLKGYHMSAAYVGEIRDVARSDHEPIVADIPPSGKKPKTKHTWGPRVLKDPDQIGTALQETPEGNTYYAQVKNICLAITKPHSDSITFHESETLQLLRREAHRTPPGQARKQAWKQVQKLRKQEHKLWEKELIDQASQMNWKAMRAIDHLNQPRHWEHRLLDPPDWPDHLQQHFKKIFNKADLEMTERKLESSIAQMGTTEVYGAGQHIP